MRVKTWVHLEHSMRTSNTMEVKEKEPLTQPPLTPQQTPFASVEPLTVRVNATEADFRTLLASLPSIAVPLVVSHRHWSVAAPALVTSLKSYPLYDAVLASQGRVRRRADASLRRIEDVQRWYASNAQHFGVLAAQNLAWRAVQKGKRRKAKRKSRAKFKRGDAAAPGELG